jgi:hypothetical protein
MTEIWIGFVVITLLLFAWMFYMMTFRTDDWLRMVKNEQERKAQAEELKKKRDERIGNAVKGAWWVAKIFLKK